MKIEELKKRVIKLLLFFFYLNKFNSQLKIIFLCIIHGAKNKLYECDINRLNKKNL